MNNRIAKLCKILEGEKLDAFFISNGINSSYLTGFECKDAFSLFTPKGNYIITDSRYKEDAQAAAGDFSIEFMDGSVYKILKRMSKKLDVRRMAFEAHSVPYDVYLHLKEELSGIELVGLKDKIESMRIIKDEKEIGLIKKALAITKGAFEEVTKYLCLDKHSLDSSAAGRLSERQLSANLTHFMLTNGATRTAFEPIVAWAQHSSRPHYRLSDVKIEGSGLLLIDIGAHFEAYNSDLTRVFFLGKISQRQRELFNIVKEASELAISKIRPKSFASAIDKTVRQFFLKNGLGKFLAHATGHGVGREVHEAPFISSKNRKRLAPNMVFTIEPGIYIPGWGGVRIEEEVRVTETGCEVLSGDISSNPILL